MNIYLDFLENEDIENNMLINHISNLDILCKHTNIDNYNEPKLLNKKIGINSY